MSEVLIESVSVGFGRPPVPVLHAIDLRVGSGEILALLGTSGSGKTTLLRSINRLLPLLGGRIKVAGRDVSDVDPVVLRLSIGYVLQGGALFPHWTVAENIGFVPRLLGWAAERIDARAEELLELVRLDPEEYKDRIPASLSGGQQQRVGVARALAAEPPLVLMDEPFGALDPLTREELQGDFQSLQRDLGFTAIVVTHDVSEALLLADRIAVMSRGRLVQVGTPRQIMRSPANRDVEALLNTPHRQATAWKELLGA